MVNLLLSFFRKRKTTDGRISEKAPLPPGNVQRYARPLGSEKARHQFDRENYPVVQPWVAKNMNF